MTPLELLTDVFDHLRGPWILMSYSLWEMPGTISSLIIRGDYSTLFSFEDFSELNFGSLWAVIGPEVKKSAEPRVIPLLEGRVKQGAVTDKVVGTPVHGTVLEIGAGSGNWADVFAKVSSRPALDNSQAPGESDGVRQRGPASKSITKIYGVEPNPQSCVALRQRVKDVGLGESYHVVPVGIEHLDDPSAWDGRIAPESVDCIVCVLCLCSIPEPEKNVALLYRLLKPGGTWYVYEHVKVSKGGLFMKLYQRKSTIPINSEFVIHCCPLVSMLHCL